MAKKLPVALICIAVWIGVTAVAPAELLLLERSRRLVLRFADTSGALLNSFGHDTEAYGGITLGPGGNIYLTSNTLGYGEIHRFDRNGVFLGILPITNLYAPGSLAFGPDANLYVVGRTNLFSDAPLQILRYHGISGAFIDVFISFNPGNHRASFAQALVFRPDRKLYVALDHSIQRYDASTGAFIDTFVPPASDGSIADLAFGPDGNLYQLTSNSVRRFDGSTGAFLGTFIASGSGGLSAPRSLAFGPDGNLYVSSQGTAAVLRFDGQSGAFLDTFVSHPHRFFPKKWFSHPGCLSRESANGKTGDPKTRWCSRSRA